MLHQLSLRELEVLQAKLAEVEKILNPAQLNYESLYNTSNYNAIRIKLLQEDVLSYICKISKEQNKR